MSERRSREGSRPLGRVEAPLRSPSLDSAPPFVVQALQTSVSLGVSEREEAQSPSIPPPPPSHYGVFSQLKRVDDMRAYFIPLYVSPFRARKKRVLLLLYIKVVWHWVVYMVLEGRVYQWGA